MCVNNNCDKNALDNIDAILVNVDGDFACNEHCNSEYEKQRAHFFNTICQSEETTTKWLMGIE